MKAEGRLVKVLGNTSAPWEAGSHLEVAVGEPPRQRTGAERVVRLAVMVTGTGGGNVVTLDLTRREAMALHGMLLQVALGN